MKLKKLLVLPLLFCLVGCTPTNPEDPSDPDSPVTPDPEDPEDSDEPEVPDYEGEAEATHYKVLYKAGDKAAIFAAEEFVNALKTRKGLIAEIEEYNNPTGDYIYFASDETEAGYKVSKSGNNISVTSNHGLGLIEGARNILSKVGHDFDVSELYKTAVTGTYSLNENKVKMMSYNVRTANDGTRPNGDKADRKDRAPRIMKNIFTYMPDTVGVQEASDDWMKTYLKPGLMPQYGMIGHGRDAPLTGETNAIFYNRDTVTLVEGGTKWLSDTPDVPGSGFAGVQYKRILTYGIFTRHSDNFTYMHINTHLDLEDTLNYKDALVIEAFAELYKKNVPIFVTGDFNAQPINEGLAYDALVNDFNWVDSSDEAIDWTGGKTFSQDGYNDPGSNVIIDFCLKANPGLYFTKYLVDYNKYSGDGVEKPQVTSDHYPVYCEALPYKPLVNFEEFRSEDKAVEIDNEFVHFDSKFNVIRHSSSFAKVTELKAIKADHNGTFANTYDVGHSQGAIENLDATNGYLEYKFTKENAGKGDLVMVMSNPNAAKEMAELGSQVTLTLNGQTIDVSNIKLRRTTILLDYEWENLVLRNVDLLKGENTLRIAAKSNVCPNQLLLEVFSDETVTPIESQEDPNELSNYIALGDEKLNIKAFNQRYPNTTASVETLAGGSVLTLTTAKDTVTDINNLTNTCNFDNYNKVVFAGEGTIKFTLTALFDGCHFINLEIQENATVHIKGGSNTQKTGYKVFQTGDIYGTLKVEGFLNAFCIAGDKTLTLKHTIHPTGKVEFTNCTTGFYTYNGTKQIPTYNVNGKLSVNVIDHAFMADRKVNINFGSTADVDITTTGSTATLGSINFTSKAAGSTIAIKDEADVNITSSQIGIAAYNSTVKVQGSSSLNITSVRNAISGVSNLIVANESGSTYTDCNADVTLTSTNDNVIYTHNAQAAGKIVFQTLGSVAITAPSSKTKTGIQVANPGQTGLTIKCKNFTITNANNAFGCWVSTDFSATYTVDYDYDTAKGYNKITLVDCVNIHNDEATAAKIFAIFDTAGIINIVKTGA